MSSDLGCTHFTLMRKCVNVCLVTGTQKQLVPVDNHCVAVLELHVLPCLVHFCMSSHVFLSVMFLKRLHTLWNTEYDGSLDGALSHWLM